MHLRLILLLCLGLCALETISESVKEPFILKNGVKYRDMLTLMASQAVADYADTYSRREQREIQHNKAVNKSPVQSPKFYSLRLDTPTGVSAENNALYFSTSRHISLDPSHAKERVLADKDEKAILSDSKGPQRKAQSPAPLVSQLPSRRRNNRRQQRQQGQKKGQRGRQNQQNRNLYKTATKFGGPSSSYSIIRAPGINVGIDTNHGKPQPKRRTPPRRRNQHTPSYSYTINTGAAVPQQFRRG